ncbi:hypothetical protein FA04_09170 [Ensifer adhaerens]|nr:hypothetical protein FA04_09170 [Ensifer adhaerens]KDP76263.1 hypothetical protein FA04_30670 [Ensifer adhaerens]KQX32842.1 hypothetical protein ASD01_02600 [Ensifer sp. Root423]KQZ58409.1 hypothetical protein ASD63_02600 [Ensifer sp. Root558]
MQTFVKPVISWQTTFEAAWHVEDPARDNMLFAISADQASGGHEQVPATMNERPYAEVLAELQARAGYEASADWTPVMINGQGAPGDEVAQGTGRHRRDNHCAARARRLADG